MKLILTAAQASQIEPHLTVGRALLGRVLRKQYDPASPATAGRLTIELGSVPEASLPALRAAIRAKPKKKARAK